MISNLNNITTVIDLTKFYFLSAMFNFYFLLNTNLFSLVECEEFAVVKTARG